MPSFRYMSRFCAWESSWESASRILENTEGTYKGNLDIQDTGFSVLAVCKTVLSDLDIPVAGFT